MPQRRRVILRIAKRPHHAHVLVKNSLPSSALLAGIRVGVVAAVLARASALARERLERLPHRPRVFLPRQRRQQRGLHRRRRRRRSPVVVERVVARVRGVQRSIVVVVVFAARDARARQRERQRARDERDARRRRARARHRASPCARAPVGPRRRPSDVHAYNARENAMKSSTYKAHENTMKPC